MRSRWSESWSHFDGLIDPSDIVVRDVRLQTNAGWYIGTVQFYNFEEMDFYSRDSDYYPNEKMLKEEYPHSISTEEAFMKIKHDRLLRRKMDKKLKNTLIRE